MATATENPPTGEYRLDSIAEHLVYVPPQCAGARRCPLIAYLPGGPGIMEWQRPVADKYGMVLLLLYRMQRDGRPVSWPAREMVDNPPQQHLDAALQQVLRKFAIDPDKIALVGRCEGGPPAIIWGGANLDVFSRIVPISGLAAVDAPATRVDAPKKTTEFLLDGGYGESFGNFRAAQTLRRAGHSVKHLIGFRGHEHQAEDYDFVGHWLQDSWAKPNARRPRPAVVPEVLLTPEAIGQMTTFWTRFMQAPESIRTTGRRAHLREVTVPVGEERPSVIMVDIAALAAQYPSVAADLTAAGLTAQQHEAYRIALLSARTTKNVFDETKAAAELVAQIANFPSVAALVKANGVVVADIERQGVPFTIVKGNSILAKNLEFVNAHPAELDALGKTGMWSTP